MSRWSKAGIIVGITGAVIVIALAIAVAVLMKWDWDRSRPWINDKVSQAIGREFTIRGHVTVVWQRPLDQTGWRRYVPVPRFTANDVGIKNPAWAKQPDFATLDQIHFDVALLPLLHRQITIPAIALINPAIDLERLKDGTVNWTFKTTPSSNTDWVLQLDQVTFAAGTIKIADQVQKIDALAEIRPVGETVAIGGLLDKSPPATHATVPAATIPYGFAFTIKGTHNNAALTGSGKFGGVLSLTDNSHPFPLEADIRVGDSHMVIAGTVTDPGNLAALDLQLQLASGSMAHLYPLTGVTLPETPPFTTRGHLSGKLSKSGNVFKYEKFSGRVGGSDLAGNLDYATGGARPKLSGDLRSEKLIFSDLAPLIGANPSAKGKPAVKRAEVKEIPGHAIPATQFKTDRWKAMDADVKFVGKQIIRPAALPVNNVSAHVIMNDGALSLNPLKFGVAGGTLSGNIELNGRKVPLQGKFSLSARDLRLKQLFPTFEPMRTSFGAVNGDADLSAVGNSPAALAATLNGGMKLLLTDGAISGALLEQAGLNVANIVLDKLFGDKIVKINCAAADFDVRKGILVSRVFALDTADALISVDGTVNLASEEMDLNVYPHTKGFRILSLRSPLYVKGTFKNPKVGVAIGPLATRGAAAVGLGLLNPVAALLALIAPSNTTASPCPAIIADTNKKLRGAGAK